MMDKNSVLIFVHIEKAAGTTFMYVLRRNFLFKCVYLRPLFLPPSDIRRWGPSISKKDIDLIQYFVPKLRCIGAHAISGSLSTTITTGAMAITLLRDPVERYISQFFYSTEVRKQRWSFSEFLEIEELYNFQLKKIAGSENLEEGKRILKSFALVGLTEYFDEFLVLLRRQLGGNFDIQYHKKNTRSTNFKKHDLVDKYGDRIRILNSKDIALYEYVRCDLLPSYRSSYGIELGEDVAEFQNSNAKTKRQDWRIYADFLFRRLYLDPIIRTIRLKNGLTPGGFYASRRPVSR